MTNLYKLFNLPKGAPLEEVKSAFRKLAFQLHPDVHGGDRIKSEKYLEVSNAYAILGNPDEKRKYDSTLIMTESTSHHRSYNAPKSSARTVHETMSKTRQHVDSMKRKSMNMDRGFDVNRWYSEETARRPQAHARTHVSEPEIDLENKLDGFSESEKAEILEKMRAKLRRASYY